MVVVGGARQQSDGKSGKRAILLFQVSLSLTMSVSMICEKNALGWETILVNGLVKCVPAQASSA